MIISEPYLVLDVETGGKKFTVHPVLTLGAVILQPDGSITNLKEWKVQPEEGMIIDPDALQKNGINIEEHKLTAQLKRDVNMEFNRYVKEHFKGRRARMMGHNLVTFDVKFIQKFQPNFWELTSDYMVVDTMLLAGYMREFGIISPPNIKLDILCNYLGIDPGMSHNALADCIATAKVYMRLREIMINRE